MFSIFSRNRHIASYNNVNVWYSSYFEITISLAVSNIFWFHKEFWTPISLDIQNTFQLLGMASTSMALEYFKIEILQFFWGRGTFHNICWFIWLLLQLIIKDRIRWQGIRPEFSIQWIWLIFGSQLRIEVARTRTFYGLIRINNYLKDFKLHICNQ